MASHLLTHGHSGDPKLLTLSWCPLLTPLTAVCLDAIGFVDSITVYPIS